MKKAISNFFKIILIGSLLGYSFIFGYNKGLKDQNIMGEAISRYFWSFDRSTKDLDILKRSMAEIASSEYIKDKYNCVDFSYDLKAKLEDAGIKSQVVFGTKDGEGHAWVVIEIEATSGKFIHPDEDYKLNTYNPYD